MQGDVLDDIGVDIEASEQVGGDEGDEVETQIIETCKSRRVRMGDDDFREDRSCQRRKDT